MRPLLYLFSLYLLVLAGIPCQADDDCCVAEIAAGATQGQPTKADGQRHCPGACSPFFACGACHGFVVPDFPSAAPALRPDLPTQEALYKGRVLPDFHASIWQPPKRVLGS